MNKEKDVVAHQVYNEGKVQTLGLETAKGPATVGVMKKGNYRFSTVRHETILVVSGVMNLRIVGGAWGRYADGDQLEVPEKTTFDLINDTEVAYICYYS